MALRHQPWVLHVTLHDGLGGGVVAAVGLFFTEAGLEKHLEATEALAAETNDISFGSS
jgi:hypothetical protein